MCEAWTFGQWLAAGAASLFFLYLAARVVSAAVFKSKQDHETRKVT